MTDAMPATTPPTPPATGAIPTRLTTGVHRAFRTAN